MSNEKKAIKATWFSLVGNTALALLKAATGVLGNSYALIADAIESTADIFSSFLVLLGLKYTSRPADANHPYGHGRAEPLFTFLIVGFLVTTATIIAIQSIKNIQTPHELPKSWTLIVLLVIIMWKEVSFRIVLKRSKETNSSSLKADAWHHRSDAITSVAAFIGITLSLTMGKGYEAADDWAALFASGIILYNSYLIFRPALGEIMDEQLYDELVAKIRNTSLTVQGVLDTEKCYIRKTGMKYHVDLHAVVDGSLSVKQGHDIAHRLQDTLREKVEEIGHVFVHIEPYEPNELSPVQKK